MNQSNFDMGLKLLKRQGLPPPQEFFHGMKVRYFMKNNKVCVAKEQFGLTLFTFWDAETKWMPEDAFNQLF